MSENNRADAQYMIGRAWRERGQASRAIASFKAALSLNEKHGLAHLELAQLLLANNQIAAAEKHVIQAWRYEPLAIGVQDILVDVLVTQNKTEKAFELLGLVQKSKRSVQIDSNELICYSAVRNEVRRLPYFLEHYRSLGIQRFLIVDNNSSDSTLEYLLEQPDIDVWQSDHSFKQMNYGMGWVALLLRVYANLNWVLGVDADELFVYESYESNDLHMLCAQLEHRHMRACGAIMLDMYSKTPICDAIYEPGTSFIDTFEYFDKKYYHTKLEGDRPYYNQTVYRGGVRTRVFQPDYKFLLSKVPLFKYGYDCYIAGGNHWTKLPASSVFSNGGCLLHFKFLSDFAETAGEEVARGEHSNDAREYRFYSHQLQKNPNISLYQEHISVKYEGSKQLVEMGVIEQGLFDA